MDTHSQHAPSTSSSPKMTQHLRQDGFPVRSQSLSFRHYRVPMRTSSVRETSGQDVSHQQGTGIGQARPALAAPPEAAPNDVQDEGIRVHFRPKLARPPVKNIFPVRELSGESLYSARSSRPAPALCSPLKPDESAAQHDEAGKRSGELRSRWLREVYAAGGSQSAAQGSRRSKRPRPVGIRLASQNSQNPPPEPPKAEEEPGHEPAGPSQDPPTPTRPPPPPPGEAAAEQLVVRQPVDEIRHPTPQRSHEKLPVWPREYGAGL